ncbi:hypothetical protein OBBRIDRAFT_770939 [Obba rivulosa]|uniref:F-box domain-containing protein n=1 Tax=Obba rivulosa TaxID=1052685 RepID=A0A8E2J3A3_9APHY|nr:hypothetical protein OBBRIDRAFT_770939 [Obba rivulosa]
MCSKYTGSNPLPEPSTMVRTYAQSLTLSPKRRKSRQDPEAFAFPLLLPSPGPASSLDSRASLAALPDDILLLIINFLYVKDILCLRQTSRRLHGLTKLRWVWHSAIQRHVIDRGLPIPAAAADLRGLSAAHLEARVVHAARFHENWNAPRPAPRRSVKFDADPADLADVAPDEMPAAPRPVVKQVLFLPGRSGEYVVTLVGRTIACWEVPLDGSGAYRVAVWESPVAVDQVVVNEDPTHEAVVAFTSGDKAANGPAEVTMLRLDKFHGRFVVHSKARIRRNLITPLWLMRGDYIVAGEVLMVLFFGHPVQFVPLMNVHDYSRHNTPDPDNKVLTVKAVNRFLVIVRERAIEVVYTPSWKGSRVTNTALMEAGAHAQIDTHAIEAAVVVRGTSLSSAAQPDWPSETVSVLRRCRDDGFHTIEQFDLLPMQKAPNGQEQPKRPCVFSSQYTWIKSVPPSCGSLRAGASGKGFWMQTENVTSRHSVYPARSLIGFDIRGERGEDDRSDGKKGDTERRHPGWNELQVGQNPVYSRRCAMGEILEGKYFITSNDLEDTVGRIALGDRHGRVEVLDYA